MNILLQDIYHYIPCHQSNVLRNTAIRTQNSPPKSRPSPPPLRPGEGGQFECESERNRKEVLPVTLMTESAEKGGQKEILWISTSSQ